MPKQAMPVTGIVAIVVALILAGIAFSQQQQAARNEATAIALANAAEAAQATAVAQSNQAVTAQAQSEAAAATAVANASRADEARSTTEAQQATAQLQANQTVTAQVEQLNQQATAAAQTEAEAADVQATLVEQITVEAAEAKGNATLAALNRMQVRQGESLRGTLAVKLQSAEAQARAAERELATAVAPAEPSPVPSRAQPAASISAGEDAMSTYTTQNGSIVFQHPADWRFTEGSSDFLLFTNDTRGLFNEGELPTGTYSGMLSLKPTFLYGSFIESVEDLAPYMIGSMGDFSQGITFDHAAEGWIGRDSGARMVGSGPHGEAVFLARKIRSDGFIWALGYSAPGEIKRLETSLKAVLASVE